MRSLRGGMIVLSVALLAGAFTSACRATYVVVPSSGDGYTAADTLWGYLDGEEVRVTFRFDTVTRIRVDTVLRVDTLRMTTTDPSVRRPARVGAEREPDLGVVVDTVFRIDTVRVVVTDTVVRTETVRVPGQRVLFVPPGQHPPEGQCRVWIHNLPPGQQAAPAPCDALGEIPDGAFILFGREAWDFDYDWLREARERPGAVPPEIVALQRPGRRQGSDPPRSSTHF